VSHNKRQLSSELMGAWKDDPLRPALQMLNEKQTAQLLAVSKAALRRWRREQRGPQFVRCERCVRYEMSAIEKYLIDNSSDNKKAADSQSAAQREARVADATTQT
jgi:hypothetical protein